MFMEFLSLNYMTVLIVIALMIVYFVYREYKIPSSGLVPIISLIILINATTYYLNIWSYEVSHPLTTSMDMAWHIKFRTIVSTIDYIIQPLIIMLELQFVVPNMRHKLRLAIPALLNALIYATSSLTGGLGFYIDEDNAYKRGPLGYTIFYVMIFYLCVFIYISIRGFIDYSRTRGLLIVFISFAIVLTMLLEATANVTGYVDEVTAISVLVYYIYLISVYQQELKNSIAEKELKIAKDKVDMLQEQIRPHFIFNSLNVIRALIKRDPAKAIAGIDNFAGYLRGHVYALKNNDLVTFEDELVNVRAFIGLVQPTYDEPIDITYDLNVTDFMIPPLSLEPIVENAVKHGIDKTGGYIRILTRQENDTVVITVLNSNAKVDYSEKERARLGVGLENTRTRLKLLLNGSVELLQTEAETTVNMYIPIKKAD